MAADRFLAAQKQLEYERAADRVHRRNDDVGKLGVRGNFEFREIGHPVFPAHLHMRADQTMLCCCLRASPIASSELGESLTLINF